MSEGVEFPSHRWMVTLIVCGAILAGSGCVSRRLLVNSNPPGALVLVDGREVGRTPLGVDFTYYGTREITLVKDGYETLNVLQPVKAPWYQWPGIDFFSDNLLPFRVTDRRQVSYEMQPVRADNTSSQGGLIDRAQGLRSETQLNP